MAMTASFSGSAAGTASMNVPHTQNTAPVLEFRCLYTQDLRRKQKRWQDGRLKFHTFNKRVMVYDDRSNFVGDTHWREDSEFAEGEELELERSGTLVEVGECVGKRDQDLTELVDKRVKEREERAASKVASPAASIYRTQGTPTPNALKAKSLNALVTPSGHYGRALLPVTSPFEDRQGLAGAQEKHEQERPAKRRKPNESAPSKNGYAQNLMGATLSLSSSRPPSTGPIRYEPVRSIPSVPVRPEPIDLTLEGSDDSDQGTVRRTEEMRDRTEPSKKPRRSPPEKSGYASNLTGASLTLSRPESFRANRPSKLSAPRDVLRNTRMHEISSDDEESFSEAAAPQKPPVAKKAKKPKEVPRPQKPSMSPLRSSSSPARNKKAPMSDKEIRRPKSVIQNSSVVEPAPERPTSALRIKSRSGPRMMMLMERPSSRGIASAESSGVERTKATPVQQAPKPSNDIVLSQATRELNAFCQKQEERLQARLRGERRNTIMDLDEDDISSSPVDSGIDHQTIDRLLSRRSKSAGRGRMASLTSSNSLEEPIEEQASKELPQLAREEQQKSQELSTSNPDNLSPLNTAGNIAAELSSQEIGPRPSIVASSDVENIEHPSPQSPSAGGSGQSVHTSPVRRSEAPSTIPPPAQTSINGSGPENLKKIQRKPKPLPQHVIGDIQTATEHFRAVLKSSASQQHDLAGVPSRSPENEQRIEIIRPITEVREAIPRVLPPKTFSELLQPPDNEVISQPELPEIEAAPRAPIAPAAISSVASVPPLRRIMNPATRGKSVQTLAANTVDTLNNPLPNIMGPPPPPPRLTSRSETLNGRNDVANGETDGGPWSREAFDLFDIKLCERIMTVRAANSNSAIG